MADTKISDLPEATTLDGAELALLSQAAADAQAPLSRLRDELYWTRPTDWPAMPTTAANTFHGLLAISDHGSNIIAVRATTSSGTWSVNWGDGTSSTGVTSNVTAEHTYDFADGDLPSVTSRGYKVATVTITPDSGNLTGLFFHLTPTGTTAHSPPWLEMQINASSATSIFLGSSRLVEHVNFVSTGALTSLSFAGLSRLQRITRYSGLYANLTSMSAMFQLCASLRRIDLTDLSASVTTLVNAFNGCSSLTELVFPSGSLGSGMLSINSAFGNCYRLRSITWPSGALQSVTDATGAFSGCAAIDSLVFPSGALASTTNFTNFVNGASALRYVEFTSALTAVTNASGMFANCAGLQRVKCASGGFGSLATTTSMFINCPTLSRFENCSIPVSFSVASSRLSSAALDEIYTALPSASATITVTGNIGTSADDPTIATGKGWTVTGS